MALLYPLNLFLHKMSLLLPYQFSGARYTRIVAPSVAAWACLGGSTGFALGKPMQQKMAPQCVYTRPLTKILTSAKKS